jgi:hypothetical protein
MLDQTEYIFVKYEYVKDQPMKALERFITNSISNILPITKYRLSHT